MASENLLLNEDGNLKVTEFELSAFSEHLKQDEFLYTMYGTPAYVAHKVITKKGCDESKADIWSYGEELEFEAFNGDKSSKPETLNVFHIISLCQGFDLSSLFEEKKREENDELRFARTRPTSSVISRLKEVAKSVKFHVKKSKSSVRL
ncbi:hypothetical protein V6N12_016249 [Hibiscus sabdariffa]|uniref:non-specific serine/threonine protein kinase n=1 Tax=Hibiscus sabdariffa TaxID=183260 RepID=A0ABR2CD08_9ROSI